MKKCKSCINYYQFIKKKWIFWVKDGKPFCALAKDFEKNCKEYVEVDDE